MKGGEGLEKIIHAFVVATFPAIQSYNFWGPKEPISFAEPILFSV